MFEFHYKTMKHNFDCKLLYSDTDSLVYEVQTQDFIVDTESKQLNEMLDFSNFPKNHQQCDETNAKLTLKFKDKMAGLTVSEFVGLEPTLYLMKLSEGKHLFFLFASFLLRRRREKSVRRRDRWSTFFSAFSLVAII